MDDLRWLSEVAREQDARLREMSRDADRRGVRRAFRESQEIVSGDRRLIDSKYVWHWVVVVGVGSGLFMLTVGWVLRGIFGV